MQLLFHKDFLKRLKKLQPQDRERLRNKLQIFREQPHHPILRNHSLHGSYVGFHSIDIKPDLRAVYKILNGDSVMFQYLGSHSQLYK